MRKRTENWALVGATIVAGLAILLVALRFVLPVELPVARTSTSYGWLREAMHSLLMQNYGGEWEWVVVPEEVVERLYEHGIVSLEDLGKATDEELLGIKGIGAGRLKALREL